MNYQTLQRLIPKKKFACLYWTKYSGRIKVYVNFKTDSHKFSLVVYRYGNDFYLKDEEVKRKLTEYFMLLVNRVNQLDYFDINLEPCIILEETTVQN